MDQFESFETKRFVSRLLGRGDVSGLMDKIQVGARVERNNGVQGNVVCRANS
jgi:signal recognition particle GTPase